MILTSIILGAVTVTGLVGIVATFWNDIIDFLKKGIEKVRQVVKGIIYGSKVFIQKIRGIVRVITRYYSRNDELDCWEETTYTRPVSESEVPPNIREKYERTKEEEVDITNETEEKMQLTA